MGRKFIQKSNFRVQGMFCNNCIEKNQNQTHFEKGTSESLYYLALIPPCIYAATISIIKKLQYNFPKMKGGGGSKAIWNFSENSSDLVAPPFPCCDDDTNDAPCRYHFPCTAQCNQFLVDQCASSDHL